MDKKTSGPERRTVMKAVGATAGIGSFSTISEAAKTDGFGSVRFLEMGMKYEIEENPSLQTSRIDVPRKYYLQPEEEKLNLIQTIGEQDKRKFAENDVVVSANGFIQALPTIVSGDNSTQSITTGLTSGLRSATKLHLDESYSEPRVEIRQDRERLAIVGEKVRKELRPNTALEHRFYPDEAIAQALEVKNEKVDAQWLPEHARSQKTEIHSKQVKVTPVVQVHDYGELTVLDRSGSNEPLTTQK